jgi:hypothetical protein
VVFHKRMEAGLWPVEEMQHGTKVQKVCVLAIGELVARAARSAVGNESQTRQVLTGTLLLFFLQSLTWMQRNGQGDV